MLSPKVQVYCTAGKAERTGGNRSSTTQPLVAAKDFRRFVFQYPLWTKPMWSTTPIPLKCFRIYLRTFQQNRSSLKKALTAIGLLAHGGQFFAIHRIPLPTAAGVGMAGQQSQQIASLLDFDLVHLMWLDDLNISHCVGQRFP